MTKYETRPLSPFVEENRFRTAPRTEAPLPAWEDGRALLPRPFWSGHEDTIAAYNRAWEIAFGNLKSPNPGSGFIENYIDTAYNGNLFLWDSVFILMFGRYGERAFPFQRTLDNFYAKQHDDGFICRELNPVTGGDLFERQDPSSTGPELFAWSEWEYYLRTGDRRRLEEVFPPLLAYHRWLAKWRTWRDGTYFSSGWGCGMDNQPRLPAGYHVWWDHGHMSWADTTFQAILSRRLLLSMAQELGREREAEALRNGDGLLLPLHALAELANRAFWNEELAFYTDRFRDGTLSSVKSVGAYWALLAGIVPHERLRSFVAHLENPAEFARPHRVPSLSADHPDYRPEGEYWRGSVWPSTVYMTLRGLSEVGEHRLAHEIALNHLENVIEVFRTTGTFWENYAPERPAQGSQSKPEFVGWTGLPPITVLLEYVFGLRPDVPSGTLVWDIRLTEEHGVSAYPYGTDGLLELRTGARSSADEEPDVTVKSTIPVEVIVRWGEGKQKRITAAPRSD